jgi:RimJ/RimL family protein N-acetyltransferase
LKFRRAIEADVELLFDWANDLDVRQNAINTQLITWEGHQKWFQKRLDSSISKIFIFLLDEQPIGQVRFEFEKNVWLIDYSVDKLYRGKGLGKSMLKEILNYFKANEPIIAYVKVENIASAKIFNSLGFKKNEIVEINKINYQIFEKWKILS